MVLKNLTIQLDNPYCSYFSGQKITGRVKFEIFEKPKSIKGVKVVIYGWGECKILKLGERTSSFVSEEETYVDDEVNIDLKDLVQHPTSPVIDLPPGEYTFPFEYVIKENVPTSFEHENGFIRYKLKAVVVRRILTNYKHSIYITVNEKVDLNLEATALERIFIQKDKRGCFLCCVSGSFGFEFDVSRTGFVPGEKLHYNIKISNNSNSTLRHNKISLVQKTHSRALHKSEKESKTLYSVSIPDVAPHSTLNQDDANDFIIPSVPPTSKGYSKIFEVTYFLSVEVGTALLRSKKRVEIIVGNIPLRSSLELLEHEKVDDSRSHALFYGPNFENFLGTLYNKDAPHVSYKPAVNSKEKSSPDSEMALDPLAEDLEQNSCKHFIPRYINYTGIK